MIIFSANDKWDSQVLVTRTNRQLHIMYNELMTSGVYNNFIGLWYHMGYLFRNGFVCIVRRCFQTVKLLNPENIGGYHHINKIGEFLQFSSKRKGIRAWNFRMMIRKIWRFFWYQNRNNFEKNEKRKDQAPLRIVIIKTKFANLKKCSTSLKWNFSDF